MKTCSKVFLLVLLLIFVTLQTSGAILANSGIFDRPYVKINYNVTGATLVNFEETIAHTTSRHYEGQLGSGTLQVSGSVWYNPYNSNIITVRVMAGDKSNEQIFEYSDTTHGKEGITQSFNVAVEIPEDAVSGSFIISHTGNSPYGSRTVLVSGQLSRPGRQETPEQALPDEPEVIQVTALKITNCPGQLNIGESIQLMAGISPSNATNKKVNWSVDSQDIATIQPNGIIIPRAEGIITITATSAQNPKIQDQCRITINEPEEDAPTITITNCSDQLSVGDKGKFEAAVNPTQDSKGKDWRIGWIVDNPNLMNINNDTGVYETIKPGQVTVTAFLHEKSMVQAYCIATINELQVVPEPAPDLPPPSEPSVAATGESSMAEPPADDHIRSKWNQPGWLEEQIDSVIKENERLGISGSEIDAGVRFNDIKGEVWVIFNDGGTGYLADLDMELCEGDIIITYEDSEALLVLSDMSTFKMQPYTILVLDNPRGEANMCKLVWGNIKANFKRMLEDGSMNVTMNQAVAGIRGTTFWLRETGEESTVWVEEGTVLFTHKNTGVSELVSGGFMAWATEDSLFMKPFDENFSPVGDLQKATPRAIYFLVPAFLAALGLLGVALYRFRTVPTITTITIGRDPGNNFILDDPKVSRVHAEIKYKSGRYWLTDFDSSNGTKVNGSPVQGSVELKPASEVSFGNSSFYFDGKNLLPNK